MGKGSGGTIRRSLGRLELRLEGARSVIDFGRVRATALREAIAGRPAFAVVDAAVLRLHRPRLSALLARDGRTASLVLPCLDSDLRVILLQPRNVERCDGNLEWAERCDGNPEGAEYA